MNVKAMKDSVTILGTHLRKFSEFIEDETIFDEVRELKIIRADFIKQLEGLGVKKVNGRDMEKCGIRALVTKYIQLEVEKRMDMKSKAKLV